MRYSLTTGFNFGSTSGILSIAIADAFLDALGIHIFEKSASKIPESNAMVMPDGRPWTPISGDQPVRRH